MKKNICIFAGLFSFFSLFPSELKLSFDSVNIESIKKDAQKWHKNAKNLSTEEIKLLVDMFYWSNELARLDLQERKLARNIWAETSSMCDNVLGMKQLPKSEESVAKNRALFLKLSSEYLFAYKKFSGLKNECSKRSKRFNILLNEVNTVKLFEVRKFLASNESVVKEELSTIQKKLTEKVNEIALGVNSFNNWVMQKKINRYSMGQQLYQEVDGTSQISDFARENACYLINASLKGSLILEAEVKVSETVYEVYKKQLESSLEKTKK